MPSLQAKYNAAYRKTPKGCLQRAYEFAARRIKSAAPEGRYARYVGLTICSREEFYEAAMQSNDFWRLFKYWKENGFQKGQRPTPDRQDTSKGYLVDNIKWETYNINTLRALP